MRDDRERIIDILEAIERIEKYAISLLIVISGLMADVVWAVIENDLPDLKNKITVILNEYDL